jgi:N-methylhydantoinase A
VFSAFGMLLVDPRIDLVQTRVGTAEALGEIGTLLETMQAEARRVLGGGDLDFEAAADARYVGQEHTVRVPLALAGELAAAAEAFHAAHYRRYRFDLRSTPVEFVNFYLSAHRPASHPIGRPLEARAHGSIPSPKTTRRAYFDPDGWRATAVFERDDLPPGFSAGGPLIVEEPTSTSLVPPGMQLHVDGYGNLIVY